MPSVHCFVSGRVQGVGFRFFVRDEAARASVGGWVRNLPDGRVEVEASGERPKLEAFLARLRQGPPLSRVDRVEVEWKEESDRHEFFRIR